MRLVCAATLILAIVVGPVGLAQRTSSVARFEVASVRPVADPSPFFAFSQLGERVLRITAGGQLVGRAPLRRVIALAYGAEPYERIVAAEPTVTRTLDEQFEIRALPPESSRPPTQEEVKAMTRQLLAERFGIIMRIDTESVSSTVLRLVKPGVVGSAMQSAPQGCSAIPSGARPDSPLFAEAFRRSCVLTFFADRIRGTVTLDEFARAVSFQAGRPILNRTNLEGMFTIDIAVATGSFIPGAPARLGAPRPDRNEQDAPAFVDALRDQGGLSTRRERQPIRLFVVEHIGPLVAN